MKANILRSIYTIIFLCLVCTVASAQEFGAQFIVGFNAAQVDGDQFSGYHKFGLNTGMAINRDLSEQWSVQLEVLYSGKGSRKPTSEEDMTIFALRYRYLELPVLAVYQLKDKISLHAGPSIGFNVQAEFDDGREWMPANPALNRRELAGHLGLGYAISEQWELNVRHSMSLIRVGNPNNGTQFYRITANGLYNRLFTFTLRYSLK